MKNRILSILSIFMIAALVLTVSGVVGNQGVSVADTNDQPAKLVTVSGEGEMTVTPDVAYITVGVESKDADAKVAQQNNAKEMDKVIAALKAKGLTDKALTTSGYNLYQTYDYNSNASKEERDYYYVVSNTLEVEVSNIDKVGEMIDVASDAGANKINNVRFAVKDDSSYYQEALKLAMANAKGKANAIMGTFGKTAGVPYAVNESSSGGGNYVDMNLEARMMDSSAASTPIQSGDITVRASVSVSYEY